MASIIGVEGTGTSLDVLYERYLDDLLWPFLDLIIQSSNVLRPGKIESKEENKNTPDRSVNRTQSSVENHRISTTRCFWRSLC